MSTAQTAVMTVRVFSGGGYGNRNHRYCTFVTESGPNGPPATALMVL